MKHFIKVLSFIIAFIGFLYMIMLAGTDDYYTALHQVHALDMRGFMIGIAMIFQSLVVQMISEAVHRW